MDVGSVDNIVFPSLSRISRSYKDVTITGNNLQISLLYTYELKAEKGPYRNKPAVIEFGFLHPMRICFKLKP